MGWTGRGAWSQGWRKNKFPDGILKIPMKQVTRSRYQTIVELSLVLIRIVYVHCNQYGLSNMLLLIDMSVWFILTISFSSLHSSNAMVACTFSHLIHDSHSIYPWFHWTVACCPYSPHLRIGPPSYRRASPVDGSPGTRTRSKTYHVRFYEFTFLVTVGVYLLF